MPRLAPPSGYPVSCAPGQHTPRRHALMQHRIMLRRYQGPSPDEVALVEGARQLGFEFRGRTRTHATISFLGQEVCLC